MKGVDTGDFYLSETGGLTNYTAGSFTCFNDNGGTTGTAHNGTKDGDEANVSVGTDNVVHVGTSDDVVCSITNTRNRGAIELQKVGAVPVAKPPCRSAPPSVGPRRPRSSRGPLGLRR